MRWSSRRNDPWPCRPGRGAACVVAALLGAMAAPAHAQWLISAYGGTVHTESADVRIVQPALGTDLVFDAMAFESRSTDSPIYYGYRVGRRVHRRWLFAEAEVIHGKLYPRAPATTAGLGRFRGAPASAAPFAAAVQEFNLSHGMNFILFNALARRALAGRVTATARAGLGPTLPHVESVVDGARRARYEWAGIGTQLSGGMELVIWRTLALTADYKWTYARPRVSLASGEAALTTRSHHLAIGVAAALAR